MCSTTLKCACVGISLATACAPAPAVAGHSGNPDWLLFPETYKAAIMYSGLRESASIREKEG